MFWFRYVDLYMVSPPKFHDSIIFAACLKKVFKCIRWTPHERLILVFSYSDISESHV